MWIYDQDPDDEYDFMELIYCSTYPILGSLKFPKEDRIQILAVLDSKTEDYYFQMFIRNPGWIKGKEEETGVYEIDSFYISMDRPIYIKEPYRFLTNEEKTILNEYMDKHWNRLVETHKKWCSHDCFRPRNKKICCSKFRNKPIPLVHPDYTLLNERKDV